MANLKLSQRLTLIQQLLGQGLRLIDVGTDHAYLPIACVKAGSFQEALATDIAEKPLKLAQSNIAFNNLVAQIKTKCTAGLTNIKVKSTDKIAIAGMGGLEIKQILLDAIVNKQLFLGQNLVLQANWNWHELRFFLAEAGIEIVSEHLLWEKGHFYNLNYCQFTNLPYSINLIESFVGKELVQKLDETDVSTSIELPKLEKDYLNYLHRLASNKSKGDTKWLEVVAWLELAISKQEK